MPAQNPGAMVGAETGILGNMTASGTASQINELTPAEIIRWHLEAGVDEAIAETPQNRFDAPPPVIHAPQPAPQPATELVTPAPQPAPEPIPPAAPKMAAQAPAPLPGHDQALKTAVKVASEAKTLDELKAALEAFDGCGLKKTATNLVFGDGNPNAKLVLMGEAPGTEEDRQGIPFVGPGGQLLDKMLASIGLSREEVYISNTVFWRPPGNRTPSAGEISICQPFVERMLELIDPEMLLTVGGPATHSLLAQRGSISRLRGNWFSYETPRMSRPMQATAIYHPDYLLETPAMKRVTWHDLLEIRKKFDAIK